MTAAERTRPSASEFTRVRVLARSHEWAGRRRSGFPNVECRFPDGDLSVAQSPKLGAASLHRTTGLGVFPPTVPDVADHVAGDHAQHFGETVILLSREAGAQEGLHRVFTPHLRPVGEPHH